jgi:hypothetical protein
MLCVVFAEDQLGTPGSSNSNSRCLPHMVFSPLPKLRKATNMSYAVVEAHRSDIPDLITIFLDSFKDDPILGHIWPNVAPDVSHAYHSRRFTESFENLEHDGSVYRKVIEQESKYAMPSSSQAFNSPTISSNVLPKIPPKRLINLVGQENSRIRKMAIPTHPDRRTTRRKGESQSEGGSSARWDESRAEQSLLRRHQRNAQETRGRQQRLP